ncbi:MAG: hypothetical protein HY204_11675 [Nitrospirae bacterium]|nr:hypothetical protein [Nitrospirota bacterium]
MAITKEIILQFIYDILLVGGGAAVIAYYIFVWLGKRWIEGWFAKRLEAYKHAQNQELENFKYKINALFDRITKIHEKEFEVLPTAWQKLQNALGHVASVTSPFQRCPDINRMTGEQLNEFLKSSVLLDSQKQELLAAPDKFKYYTEAIFWHKLSAAQESVRDLHNYIVNNRIFLNVELSTRFNKADEVLYSALIDSEVSREANERKFISEAYKKIKEEVTPLIGEIEQLVQKRLHYDKAE